MSIDSAILTNLGGIPSCALTSLLEQNNIDTAEEPILLSHSPYLNNELFVQTIQSKQNIFKCISLNIQSLNAKIE